MYDYDELWIPVKLHSYGSFVILFVVLDPRLLWKSLYFSNNDRASYNTVTIGYNTLLKVLYRELVVSKAIVSV